MDSDSQTLQAVPRCNSPECSVDRCTFSGPANLDRWNSHFAKLAASARVESALRHLPGPQVLSSSFGAQAAVSLHMLTRHQPDIPIILADTGYLFPETYQFIDELTDRLNLNLHVVRSVKSPAWQEQRHGQRWLQGVDGIDAYNFDNKVEPVQRALNDLKVATWFSGIRRNQALSRAATPFVQYAGGRFKVCPIADWTDRDVYDYLKANELPYHPLWEKGYVSIGDVHTTRALHEVEDESETRFFGLKRECGLHDKML